MLFDQFSEPESLVEFVHQDQVPDGSVEGTLEIDIERGIEREMEGLLLSLAPGN